MKWEITKHATPEYSPQYGIYEEGSQNDFCIVKGEESLARLISAAPDLLEACEWAAKSLHHPDCKTVKDGCDIGTNCDCHVKACRAAIAKAKGA
jgi:hypothetical protein